jgi:hypothetical protein
MIFFTLDAQTLACLIKDLSYCQMTSKPSIPSNTLLSFIHFFSKTILYLTGMTLIVAGLFFLSRQEIHNNGLVTTITLITVLPILAWEFKTFYQLSTVRLALYAVASLTLIALLTFLAGSVYDKSWDGMAYHQIGIIELSKGWNPFYEQLPYESQQSRYFDREIVLNLWVNHYGKALETFSAVLMAVTGNIESGKVFNVLLLLSAFCTLFYLLVRLNFISIFWSFALAFAATFNPIAINQLFSYYLDGALGSLILILMCQLILLLRAAEKEERWPAYISIFFISIILINLKFTGLVYHAWICLVFLGLVIYLKRSQLLARFLAVATASGLVAIFVAGFNPYVTNIIHAGHPFYPLAGKNKVDAIVHMIPKPLKAHSAFGKFLASNFSRCDNYGETSDRAVEYKVPFTFSLQELKIFQSEGIRLGGFGPLWSGIFCLTAVFLAIALARIKGTHRFYLLALVAGVVGAVVINPAAWWARFIPQLWLLPVIVFAFLLYTQKANTFKFAGKAAVVLLIANSALIAVVYFYSVYASTRSANKVFDNLRKAQAPVFVYFDIFTPNQKKLEANNINFVSVKRLAELPCDSTMQILKIDYCLSQKIRSKEPEARSQEVSVK